MFENFISDTAPLRRSTVLGAHLRSFCTSLSALGYRDQTIREKLRAGARLSRWMTAQRLRVADLNEKRIDEFVGTERRRRRRRGVRATLLQLLAQLRDGGVVPRVGPASEDSPRAGLMTRYAEYLRQERALAPSTVTGYMAVVCAFVDEHLDAANASPRSLRPADVRDFLLSRVRTMAPKRAQYTGTALRSFLRFLFLRDLTSVDLSLAVPTMRQAHLVSVPRYLCPGDVKRLLVGCDRSSVTGRRDYAILLLLARLGVRAGEIMALQLGDLRWRQGEIIIRGKGLIHDRLPLPTDVGQALAVYLQKDRPSGPSRHVFLCRKAPHRGFSHPSTVTTIVMRALDRAGLRPATRGAHLLRHSLATTMVRRGASFAEIGQVLRHRSPNSTEIYAKLDFGSLRDVTMPWPVTGVVQ